MIVCKAVKLRMIQGLEGFLNEAYRYKRPV